MPESAKTVDSPEDEAKKRQLLGSLIAAVIQSKSQNVPEGPARKNAPLPPAESPAPDSRPDNDLQAASKATSSTQLPQLGHPAPPVQLEPRQIQALELILQGVPDVEVAVKVGVDRRTIYRWRQQPAFARELDAELRVIRRATTRRLSGLMPRVIDMLEKQLGYGNTSASQKAAGLLLRVGYFRPNATRRKGGPARLAGKE